MELSILRVTVRKTGSKALIGEEFPVGDISDDLYNLKIIKI